MKLLIIGNDRKLFDAKSGVSKRIKEYSSLVDELVVIVYAKKQLGFKKYVTGNLTVIPTNSHGVFFYILNAFTLGFKIIKKWKEDVPDVTCLVSVQDPHETGIVGMLLKFVTGSKLQVQDHAGYYLNHNWRSEKLQNFFKYYFGIFVLKYADGIRAVSSRIKNVHHSKFGIPMSRIVVVHVRSQFEKIRESKVKIDLHEKYPEAERIILTTARLVRPKNLPLLIQSFAQLLKKHPRAFLVIVGKGSEKDLLVALTKKLNIEKNVTFESWTDDVASYMKTADMYALSSSWEGWGMVVIEAMAAGLPVIMTDVGCANELIHDGVNGTVVSVDDLQAFTAGLIALYEDNTLRDTYIKNGNQTIKDFITQEEHLKLHKKSFEVCFDKDEK